NAVGLLLHPARLDPPEVLAGADGRRRDVVDRVVDDATVEPPGERADAPADDDEDQVIQVVEPPLVERGPVQEWDPGGQRPDPLRSGPPAQAAEADAERPPRGHHAEDGDDDAGEE